MAKDNIKIKRCELAPWLMCAAVGVPVCMHYICWPTVVQVCPIIVPRSDE